MPEPILQIVPGQRWVSESEPDIGLGSILEFDGKSLVVEFRAADEVRRYAAESAPLRRVRFGPGDAIADVDGTALTVSQVEEHEGLLVYLCGERVLPETLLSDHIDLTGPRERLISGRTDPPRRFELRREALERLSRIRKSAVRGFLGPRLELLPHQFYVASEVTRRHAPRVLLADETGMGKTIEAGLCLSRLLHLGRASRVLILVPDSLLHQWLVELRRRFNLRFALYDESRCAAITEMEPEANPFLEEQLVLAGLSLLAEHPEHSEQAALAGWDVVVVDEAHRLAWSASAASPEYRAVEALARGTAGLMLLTATPAQLGEEGHFARLRLLDPDRHADFDEWRRESEGYKLAAGLGTKIGEGVQLSESERSELSGLLGVTEAEIKERESSEDGRHGLLKELIDRHGPGRVMFRNRRSSLTSFPERVVDLRELELGELDSAPRARIHEELQHHLGKTSLVGHRASSRGMAAGLEGDPRIARLLELLRTPDSGKVLVICRSADACIGIKRELRMHVQADIALFHEDLSLIQRDRNAAWFADPSGAAMLICSEIGSEGRNFQHAQHLVMFDLPLDPDLVEQRIGRLDRIGQKGSVRVEVLIPSKTGLQVVAGWHDEGVGSFGRPRFTALPLLSEFGQRVRDLALANRDPDAWQATCDELSALVAETKSAAETLASQLEGDRDRLLEMASLEQDTASRLIEQIEELDEERETEEFFLRLLEHFHVHSERVGPRTYLMQPGGMHDCDFPTLSRGPVTVTFSRQLALVREDLEFITLDHPLLLDAMELFLASESGNASFGVSRAHESVSSGGGEGGFLLETVFVLAAVAPPGLNVDCFLPPTPIRVVVDQAHRRAVADELAKLDEMSWARGEAAWLAEHQDAFREQLLALLDASRAAAETEAEVLRKAALDDVESRLGAERERLLRLSKVNDQIRPEELIVHDEEMELLARHVSEARVRLDSCRLSWLGPSEAGIPTV